MYVSNEECALFSTYIHEITGLVIDEEKKYLLENRFDFLCRELGLNTLYELYIKARNDRSRALEYTITDLITTHESSFFRDETPFEIIRSYVRDRECLERLEEQGSWPQQIDVWSTACANGQEIYSVAMVLREILGPAATRRAAILGTDISDMCITRASYGKYSSLEIERGLSRERLCKYFTADGEAWKVCDEIRAMTSFRRINLLDDFSHLKKFDIVLCRNVAVYFTLEDRKRLFERMADRLKSQGIVIIGSTETLIGVSPRFQREERHSGVFYKLAR
jgi:chemotaxis protein methyltransferase CheR